MGRHAQPACRPERERLRPCPCLARCRHGALHCLRWLGGLLLGGEGTQEEPAPCFRCSAECCEHYGIAAKVFHGAHLLWDRRPCARPAAGAAHACVAPELCAPMHVHIDAPTFAHQPSHPPASGPASPLGVVPHPVRAAARHPGACTVGPRAPPPPRAHRGGRGGGPPGDAGHREGSAPAAAVQGRAPAAASRRRLWRRRLARLPCIASPRLIPRTHPWCRRR